MEKETDMRFDRMVTDPCPECALKHMSAAYAIAVSRKVLSHAPDSCVNLARAVVNLVEFSEGYTNHWGLAVGFLVLAEEGFVADGDISTARVVRSERLALMAFPRLELDDRGAISATVQRLEVMSRPFEYCAHIAEAVREYPQVKRILEMSAEEFTNEFGSVMSEVVSDGYGIVTEKGETQMTTKKTVKTAKTGTTKCAAKGGTTKKTGTTKCAAKGGCAKKTTKK